MENQFKFLLPEKRNIVSSGRYPMRFVNSVINDFESKEHDQMIPSYLFNDFDVLFCNENEKVYKQLLKKLKALTKEK